MNEVTLINRPWGWLLILTLRYADGMRRYPLLFILLLSFLMPMQTVAQVLLSGDPCPAEMAMDSTEDSDMPCCPDDVDTVALCKTLKSCHLCKTPGQLIAIVPAAFPANPVMIFSTISSPQHLALNLASIWRPPAQA